jgi:hypothetical protein
LLKKDPKSVAKLHTLIHFIDLTAFFASTQKQNAYNSLEKNASTSNSGTDNGAQSALAHREILEELYAAHGPCERLSGSCEKQVFINPLP